MGRCPCDDLVHFAGSLDECLPRAVRGGLALATNGSVNGERALLDDDDRSSRMGVPAGGAARDNRDLCHGYVRSDLKAGSSRLTGPSYAPRGHSSAQTAA